MDNIEYYKTIDNTKENVNKVLTAKIARQMTNDAIIEKVKNELLPKIEKKAKSGCYQIEYEVSRSCNIDYDVLTNYIKSLGYNIFGTRTYSNVIVYYIKW